MRLQNLSSMSVSSYVRPFQTSSASKCSQIKDQDNYGSFMTKITSQSPGDIQPDSSSYSYIHNYSK